jgi:hypothetical protein
MESDHNCIAALRANMDELNQTLEKEVLERQALQVDFCCVRCLLHAQTWLLDMTQDVMCLHIWLRCHTIGSALLNKRIISCKGVKAKILYLNDVCRRNFWSWVSNFKVSWRASMCKYVQVAGLSYGRETCRLIIR